MEKKNIYTVDYFLDKFSKIPDELWSEYYHIDGEVNCAIGHCRKSAEEHSTLGADLFFKVLGTGVGTVIHKQHPDYQQPTPKQRILAALYDIKKLSTPSEPKEEPEYKLVLKVTCSEKVKQLAKETVQLS